MFVDQLAVLQEYLINNKMHKTLQMLRQQLGTKIPNKPSNQLLSLIDNTKHDGDRPHHKQEAARRKKPQLLADGLLGRIAYSSKILEDSTVNQRISNLMDNKIFQKAVGKMFPDTLPRMKKIKGEEVQDQLERTVGIQSQGDGPSAIDPGQEDFSIVSQPSFLLQQLQKTNSQGDEYTDDNDLGYHQFQFLENQLMSGCSKLTQQYGYPESAVKKTGKAPNKIKSQSKYPPNIKFPQSDNKIYPLEYDGVIFDTMKLKIVYDRQKTGYETQKQLNLKAGQVLMGRYEVMAVLGKGVFAKVVKVKDLLSQEQELSCFKVVSNYKEHSKETTKDFIDQSFDEIKLLRLIKANCNPDQHYLLDFKGAVYYKEHLLIQTDLLKDNLYSAYTKNPSFFSLPVLKQISRQILIALNTLHSLSIIHSDLKPQNILIKSYTPVEIKIVDFGNSCFVHDSLGTYVQSRSYRAPEVVLGTGYDQKIDIWSVGCIIAELWTKNVLFHNVHLAGMLARIQSIIGPWPQWMLQNGSKVSDFFSKENLIFFQEEGIYNILMPKKTSLKSRIRTDDAKFLNFLSSLLQIDPERRCSAQQALSHPFLQ